MKKYFGFFFGCTAAFFIIFYFGLKRFSLNILYISLLLGILFTAVIWILLFLLEKYGSHYEIKKINFELIRQNLKKLLVFFFVSFVIFGIFMAVINNNIIGGIIAGLIYSVFMTTFTLATLSNEKKLKHDHLIEKDFLNRTRAVVYIKKDKKEIFNKLINKFKRDKRIKIKKLASSKDKIKVNKKISFKSWGEFIEINLNKVVKDTRVEIKSKPAWPLQIVDYNINYKNVHDIVQFVKNI